MLRGDVVNFYRIQPPTISASLVDQMEDSWFRPDDNPLGNGEFKPRDNGLAARVLWDSDKRIHLMVEKLARYFRREFDYDCVQYSAVESTTRNKTTEAFLWSVTGLSATGYIQVAIGACCFRWRKWKDAPPGWALQWIWLHPYERNQGRLTRAWPYFRERFGDFHVEPPLSPAMRAFVAKQAKKGGA